MTEPMHSARVVKGVGYELLDFMTVQGCRVQSDATKNKTNGRWDEAVTLSCPVPLELNRLPETVLAVRRRRRGA